MLTYKPYFGIQICSHNIREFFMDRINLENQEKNLELSVIDEWNEICNSIMPGIT